MAITGSYNDRLITDRDKVRARLGDTNAGAWLLSDDHIDTVLSLKGSIAGTVAYCADELIALWASQPVSQSAQGESVDYRDRIPTWKLISAQAKAEVSNASNTNSSAFTFVRATYGNPTTDEFARTDRYGIPDA